MDANNDIRILACELALVEPIPPESGEVVAATRQMAPGENHNRPIDIRRREIDDLIALEVGFAVKELFAIEIATMVEESMNGFLRKTLHNPKSGAG